MQAKEDNVAAVSTYFDSLSNFLPTSILMLTGQVKAIVTPATPTTARNVAGWNIQLRSTPVTTVIIQLYRARLAFGKGKTRSQKQLKTTSSNRILQHINVSHFKAFHFTNRKSDSSLRVHCCSPNPNLNCTTVFPSASITLISIQV